MKTTCPKCGHQHDVNAAALMGSATSETKAKSSRYNGKKGGWPKGKPRGKNQAL